MRKDKQLWILAGGNGAGKTTFYQHYLQPHNIRLINADNIARDIDPQAPEAASYDAAEVAARWRSNWLQQGRSFCFETVFSHPSKIDFVAQAKTIGYTIVLVFIHLDNPELNKARVKTRIATGGHSVPEDKIEARIPRTLTHIETALPLVDEGFLIDNSSYHNPFQRIATLCDNALTIHREPLPTWAHTMLDRFL
jgi:predicted ABC-type ATPase